MAGWEYRRSGWRQSPVVALAGLIGVYGQLDYNDRGTAMFGSIAIARAGGVGRDHWNLID
jgi:hypothetical protein